MSTINKFIERLFTMAGAEVEISPEMIKETEAFLKAETKKASKKVEKKNTKAKKDPNAPKKATNAYMIFATENRGKVLEEMKKTNENVNAKDVLKEMGARWTAAKPDVKTKYEKKLAEAKAKYVEEMKNYAPSASDSEDAPKTKVTKKTKKDVEDVKEAVKEESEDEDAPPPPKEKKVKAKKVEPEMEPEEDNIPPPPPVKKDIKKAKK